MELKLFNHPKVQYMLPLRKELRDNKRRHTEKYEIMNVNTQRRKSSAIPFMQDQLKNIIQNNKSGAKWMIGIFNFTSFVTELNVPVNITLWSKVASYLNFTAAHHCVE